MPCPNDMRWWDEITCQRGHDSHETRKVRVDLGEPHGYRDLPAVPSRLARSFEMLVWDTAVHPVDGLAYCPAADAVSETILSHATWEPSETVLTLAACSAAAPGSVVVDFGAQLGWFSLLAASCGVGALAIDAEPENLRLLRESAALNGWEPLVRTRLLRVGPGTPTLDVAGRVALAKVDVEGAEADCLRVLGPAIRTGRVDHLLVEVSPVFHEGYGDLVLSLIDAGYRAWALPAKRRPPASLERLPEDLEPGRLDLMPAAELRSLVDDCHQMNVWFSKVDAPW